MSETMIEILLVEDTRSDAEMTMRAIRRNHIANNIIHISDSSTVMDYLEGTGVYTGKEKTRLPKVILLDLKMPKVSGIELLQLLKSNPQTQSIPVVILTSSKEHPDVERCYALGVNSYIVKPVVSEEFVHVIGQLGLYWTIHNQVPDSK